MWRGLSGTLKKEIGQSSDKFLYRQLVAGCIPTVIKTLNNTPKIGSLLEILSLFTLFTGMPPPDFNTITKLFFGDYVEVSKPSRITNLSQQSTVGVLAVHPSRNAQGTWFFWLLETETTIHRK